MKPDYTDLIARLRQTHPLAAYPQWREAADAIDSLVTENQRLRALLEAAAVEIESWGAYASEYFQKKHDLAGTVKDFRDAAMGASDDK